MAFLKTKLLPFLDRVFEDNLPTHSAASAYYSVLTLAPITSAIIFFTGFLPFSSFAPLLDQIHRLAGGQVATAVELVIQKIQTPNIRSLTGLFAIVTFIFLGSALFAQLRSSLNSIFKTPQIPLKKWFLKRVFVIVFLFYLILFLVLSSAALSIFAFFESQTGIVLMPFFSLLEISLIAVAAAALYRYLPDIRLRWPAVLQGGLLASLLFALGKSFFKSYVENFAVGSVYGAASSLFIFLIWIYYSAFIFFIGAEFSFLLKERATTWYKQIIPATIPHSGWIKAGIVLMIVLGAVRALAPEFLRHRINKELQTSKDWKGYVQDVDLSLLRGIVRLQNFEFYRIPNEDFIISGKRFDLNMSWFALLMKEIRFDLRLEEPLLIVKILPDKEPEPKKEGDKKPVPQKIKEVKEEVADTAWPLYMDELVLRDGSIRIEDKTENALPTFRIKNIHIEAFNIWNQVGEQEGPSQIKFTADTSGKGRLNGVILISAFSPTPNVKAELKIQDLDLRVLNSFLEKNAKVNLTRGTLDLFAEFATRNWMLDGYLKPILTDLHFTDAEKDKRPTSFWRKVWVGFLNWLTKVFTNENTKEMAGKIPFSGRIDAPESNPISAAISIIRNAFIQALLEGFDRDLKIQPQFPRKKT